LFVLTGNDKYKISAYRKDKNESSTDIYIYIVFDVYMLRRSLDFSLFGRGQFRRASKCLEFFHSNVHCIYCSFYIGK